MTRRILFLVVALVGTFVLLTSIGSPMINRLLGPLRSDGVAWSGPVTARTAGLSSDELNNIDIYKRARLATVNITSTVYRRNWFMEVIPSRDIGSGFVLDDKGNILTNSHVLQGGGKIQVTTENHDSYDARILYRDRRNDLALIKIEPRRKLSYLPLGDSEPLQ